MRKLLYFCVLLGFNFIFSSIYQVQDEKAYKSLVFGYTPFKQSRVHDLKLLAALMLSGVEERALRLQRKQGNFFSEKEMLGIKHLGDLAFSIFKKYEKIPKNVERAQYYALYQFYNTWQWDEQMFEKFNQRYQEIYKDITEKYGRKTNLPPKLGKQVVNGVEYTHWNFFSQIWAKKSAADLEEIDW